MSHRCTNCGAHVTARYLRVRGSNDEQARGEVDVCPFCEDRYREGSGWRERRSGSRRDR